MKILTMPQRSPEWFKARGKCLLTASDAGEFLLKDDERSRKARRKRIYEYLTQQCYVGGDAWLLDIAEKERKALDYNLPVQRGNAYEDEAVKAAARVVGRPVEPVGLILTDDDLFGASPDGLFGDDAGLECKVPLPETHLGYIIEHLETGTMVKEYLHQIHMGLAVSERSTWHFYSHSIPYQGESEELLRHPPLHIEVKADATTEKVRQGMARFRRELKEIEERLHDRKLAALWQAAFGEEVAA